MMLKLKRVARHCAWSLCVALQCMEVGAQPGVTEEVPLQLALPLQCKIGVNCWVANYVDTDVSNAAHDFLCKPRSYDGHDGVDFAIRDLGVMARGVPVLASAAGVVKNVRDGVDDAVIGAADTRQRVAGRECGNGVLIEHPGGWQTQYCHMRRGSVRVVPGQRLDAGAPIGLVGLSGNTEFPHLHLTVRHTGKAIDPYTGLPQTVGCAQTGWVPLWKRGSGIGYEHVALYNAGIATGAPDYAAIQRGERNDGPFSQTAPALVLWVEMFGVQAGDRVAFRLRGPTGASVVEADQTIDRTQARRFIYVGARRKNPVWEVGVYNGEVSHQREIDGHVRTTKILANVSVH